MTMTDIARAAADDLRPILEAFRDASWPLSKSGLAAIAERLGWQLRSDRDRGVTYLTGLPYPRARADSLVRDGEVVQVTIGLTDRVDGDDRALRVPMRAIEQDCAGIAAEVLGEPGAPAPGQRRTYWDLPSSGRLAVENIEDRIILDVLAPQLADIERAEARLGVDPGRVVGEDPEPA